MQDLLLSSAKKSDPFFLNHFNHLLRQLNLIFALFLIFGGRLFTVVPSNGSFLCNEIFVTRTFFRPCKIRKLFLHLKRFWHFCIFYRKVIFVPKKITFASSFGMHDFVFPVNELSLGKVTSRKNFNFLSKSII